MFCISVSFKKTPLPIRQKFAFLPEEQKEFLSFLRKRKITGGVVLSTCNRTELYVTGAKGALEELEDALASQKGMDKEIIKNYCLYYSGKKAVRHLFRVTCGLDSMVLGEDEILRQVKEAYQVSVSERFVDGELNIIFQGALRCAKRSKAATRLSTTPLSIGTLTANAIEEYLMGQAKEEETRFLPEEREKEVFSQKDTTEGTRSKAAVLVIGATGKIGSIVAKDLLAKGISVIGTQRKKHQGEEIFFSQKENIILEDFHNRYQCISCVDAIVSATTSPHYTLTKGEYEKQAAGKKQLLIDLSVPYDIDREIGALENVTLFDIDYFSSLSRKNSHIRKGELEKAEEILQECLEEVLKNLYVREFQEGIKNRKTKEWFPNMVYYLKEVLDSDTFLEVLHRIEEKEGLPLEGSSVQG